MLTANYQGGLGNLGGFVIRSGRAVPDSFESLGDFQGLQRAINAGRQAKGLPTIDVDGEIGGVTLNAAKSLLPEAGAAFPFFTDVSTLAQNARAAANIIAASFGTSVNLTPVPAARPAATREQFPALVVPAKSGAGKALLIGGLALLGIGLVFFVAKAGKRKTKSS